MICPCCEARLLVEPSTGLVLNSKQKSTDFSFEDALTRERERKAKVDDLFAQAFADEKKRQGSLEEKFRKAMESKDELEDPTRPWDFD